MTLFESIRIALRSISANKLRSVLTMLGIIIGVGAVIALMSIGRGAQASITSQIQSIGTNLLFVRPGAANSGGVRQEAGSAQTLTYEDALALAEEGAAPAIAAVAPELRAFAQVSYQGQNVRTNVVGVTPTYLDVRNQNLASGEFFNEAQLSGRSTVAVLGASTAATLFSGEDPIDQSVRINGVNFRVIGVVEAKGGTGLGNQDDVIYVPLTSAAARLTGGQRFRGQTIVSSINVQVVEASQIPDATQQISEIIRQRHRTQFEDDFSIQSQEEILAAFTTITATLTAFLGGIAAISLVVGGIGIMNIMLVSVTERTREIGIRKAIGAKGRDILAQFLTEAVVLSVTGGVIGILIGVGVSRLITGVNFGSSPITPVVDLDAVVLAVVFSTIIGLFFGIYPAHRASQLHPIDALRYE